MFMNPKFNFNEESHFQLFSPSQARVQSKIKQTKKFEDPKKDQFRYNMLYNKINLSLRNEINKFKHSGKLLSPRQVTSRSIINQAKILLNDPSISVINSGDSKLPPISFQ